MDQPFFYGIMCECHPTVINGANESWWLILVQKNKKYFLHVSQPLYQVRRVCIC